MRKLLQTSTKTIWTCTTFTHTNNNFTHSSSPAYFSDTLGSGGDGGGGESGSILSWEVETHAYLAADIEQNQKLGSVPVIFECLFVKSKRK